MPQLASNLLKVKKIALTIKQLPIKPRQLIIIEIYRPIAHTSIFLKEHCLL
jgi:hypothetical protein